jgi:hypothetical protein
VAIINEYTGANERFSPRSVRVYPSVARTTADVLLVDAHPASFDNLGQTAHQPGRIEGGAVGGVGAAEHVGGSHHGRRLDGREQTHIVLGHPAVAGSGHLVAGPLQLHVRPSQNHGSAPGEVTPDVLGADHPFHLVHGGLHGPSHGRPGPGAAQVVEAIGRTGKEGGAPAPVASGRTETDDVPLDDADAQGGVGLDQVVGRPQTGQAPTHDGHVEVGVASEGRTLFYRAGEPVPPQGELSEALTR